MLRKRMYWILQLGGWFAWMLNEALLYTNQYGWHWAWLYASIANISLAIFLTHQYKKHHQSEFLAGFTPFNDVKEPFYHPMFDGSLPGGA